jgi:hypothetical protein
VTVRSVERVILAYRAQGGDAASSLLYLRVSASAEVVCERVGSRIEAAVSTDRSNSGRGDLGFLKQQLRKYLYWLPESEYSTRTVVQGISDGPQIVDVAGDFCSLREVFPD